MLPGLALKSLRIAYKMLHDPQKSSSKALNPEISSKGLSLQLDRSSVMASIAKYGLAPSVGLGVGVSEGVVVVGSIDGSDCDADCEGGASSVGDTGEVARISDCATLAEPVESVDAPQATKVTAAVAMTMTGTVFIKTPVRTNKTRQRTGAYRYGNVAERSGA